MHACSLKMTFVVNVKAKGKVHLATSESHMKCGWRITKGTSRVFNCNRVKYGELCKRCFTKKKKHQEGDVEAIEQYDDSL